jgi:XTP/dITP diphosphohydrolase
LGTRLFEGVCEGRIGLELKGTGGFGYDPLFYPAGSPITFGELAEAEKNKVSHRAKALAQLHTVLAAEN